MHDGKKIMADPPGKDEGAKVPEFAKQVEESAKYEEIGTVRIGKHWKKSR